MNFNLCDRTWKIKINSVLKIMDGLREQIFHGYRYCNTGGMLKRFQCIGIAIELEATLVSLCLRFSVREDVIGSLFGF